MLATKITPILMPNFAKRGGLIDVITQDESTGKVLMKAFTNEECFLKTLQTGRVVYWSTSRNEGWMKGVITGDYQIVHDVLVDCGGDAVIYVVTQQGQGACHTKARSCFYRSVIFGASLMEAPSAGKDEALKMVNVEVDGSIVDFVKGKHGIVVGIGDRGSERSVRLMYGQTLCDALTKGGYPVEARGAWDVWLHGAKVIDPKEIIIKHPLSVMIIHHAMGSLE